MSKARGRREIKKFKRLLVANRGEIAIRVLRAAAELKIGTVALYTHEDRYSLHRHKADEAYQIGPDREALKPYLDIDEIISLARAKKIDAIHPGYGFLSENVEFARRCEKEGIVFVGPLSGVMQQLGGKTDAKAIAKKLKVPVIEDSAVPLSDAEKAVAEAKRIGFPVILKAAGGGGGRGMRVIREAGDIHRLYEEARREAGRAFGNDTVFLEKFLERPKHIEVQILGDNYGNIVHLFERDCSVQRRFQKVVEVAPSPSLAPELREKVFNYSLQLAREVNYNNAGTFEFLVDQSNNVYFIEVNPRIQVEHTVTEEVTGIDLVRAQILVAAGYSLSDPEIGIPSQESLSITGFAIQCRVTSEDPNNDFKPDCNRIVAYRSPGGFGIRLDGGNAYPGAILSPSFDSLLVKVTAAGRSLEEASVRLDRALREFRIRGVKTNLRFLQNVINHPVFLTGKATVNFIDTTPELFGFKQGQDRATRLLRYLGDIIVNGNADIKKFKPASTFRRPHIPPFDRYKEFPKGSRDRLKEMGREKFISWLRNSKEIQYTDTTFRDAHQSLLATRVRTIDLFRISESYARHVPQLFSLEMWGGATFDVALRFLHECPWQRLSVLRETMPNILFQMLLRGSNAVGYTAYPDNLIERFIEESARNGIDIFRVFDSMNCVDGMRTSIRTIRERTESLAEAAICYTGDLLDHSNKKFTLNYYLDLARELEDAGAHMIGIKDMAGLLKPDAAEALVTGLRAAVALPIHLHTHDTSSIQAATYLKAVDAGVDVLDVALASMSGLTSQPNFNSIVEMLKRHERALPISVDMLNQFSNYWEVVREYYAPFESGLLAGTAEVYQHEIPGGQYSNLGPQVRSLGLEDQFDKVKQNFKAVNDLLGNIVKVTPSSKVVGDFALYLTSNNLSTKDVLERGEELSFPESLKGMLRGDLGIPAGGFPPELIRVVLKGEPPRKGSGNEHMPPVDFPAEFKKLQEQFGNEVTFTDLLSYKLYPQVFKEYITYRTTHGEIEHLPSPAFFYGLKIGEEIYVDIAEGKRLLIRLEHVGEANEKGIRLVSFNLNGQIRSVEIKDRSIQSLKVPNKKVAASGEIGAPLQGKLAKVLVEKGAKVDRGTPLFVVEAMKMETTVIAPQQGRVQDIVLREGSAIEQDDLVLVVG